MQPRPAGRNELGKTRVPRRKRHALHVATSVRSLPQQPRTLGRMRMNFTSMVIAPLQDGQFYQCIARNELPRPALLCIR